MLKIKLARFGKRNQPHYRIVVNEAKSKRDGKYTASIGHYAPTQTPKILEIDIAAFKEWTAKGAQPTDTVASLVERVESGNPFPEKKARPSKKARAKAAAEVEAKAQAAEEAKTAAAAPAVEAAPSEEVAPAAESAEAAPESTEEKAA